MSIVLYTSQQIFHYLMAQLFSIGGLLFDVEKQPRLVPLAGAFVEDTARDLFLTFQRDYEVAANRGLDGVPDVSSLLEFGDYVHEWQRLRAQEFNGCYAGRSLKRSFVRWWAFLTYQCASHCVAIQGLPVQLTYDLLEDAVFTWLADRNVDHCEADEIWSRFTHTWRMTGILRPGISRSEFVRRAEYRTEADSCIFDNPMRDVQLKPCDASSCYMTSSPQPGMRPENSITTSTPSVASTGSLGLFFGEGGDM